MNLQARGYIDAAGAPGAVGQHLDLLGMRVSLAISPGLTKSGGTGDVIAHLTACVNPPTMGQPLIGASLAIRVATTQGDVGTCHHGTPLDATSVAASSSALYVGTAGRHFDDVGRTCRGPWRS